MFSFITLYPNSIIYAQSTFDYYNDELEFKEMLKADPNNHDLHYNLALAYYNQGKLSEALSEFKQVILLKEDDSDALARLGNIFRIKRKLQLAEFNINKALSINPKDSYAWEILAFIQSDLCRSQEAIESLEKSLKYDDSLENTKFVLFYIGVLQLNLKKKDLALVYADKLEKYDSDLSSQIKELASMQ